MLVTDTTRYEKEAFLVWQRFKKTYPRFITLCYASGHNTDKFMSLNQGHIDDLFELATTKAKAHFLKKASEFNEVSTPYNTTFPEKKAQSIMLRHLGNVPSVTCYPTKDKQKMIVGSFVPDLVCFGLRLGKLGYGLIIDVHHKKTQKDQIYELINREVLDLFTLHISNDSIKCLDEQIRHFQKGRHNGKCRYQPADTRKKRINIVKLFTIAHWLDFETLDEQTGLSLWKLYFRINKDPYHKKRLAVPSKLKDQALTILGSCNKKLI